MTGYTLIRAKRRTMSLQLDRDSRRRPCALRRQKEFIDRFVAEHEAGLPAPAKSSRRAAFNAHPRPTDEERKALIARAKEYLPHAR